MQLGLIGLGKMGFNMRQRLRDGGHEVVGYDPRPEVSDVATLAELAAALAAPRVVWVMVPSGPITNETITALGDVLDPGDLVVDGGNSRYTEAAPRAARLAARGVHFLDVGTSGGIHGRHRGYCLMIGGDAQAVRLLTPVFEALAPGGPAPIPDASARRVTGTEARGWLHCGPTGAGHFVKMVHNGIEYGLMAAYAEGFNLLSRVGGSLASDSPMSPDTPGTPDVAAIAELWRRGSVIGSWLLDLAAAELAADPELSEASPRVGDSGEGRWVVQSAVELGVPVPVMAAALFSRFDSRGESEFADRVLSAMRKAFGGHGGAAPPAAR